MRKQVEILIYNYKKQNNLDVYSALNYKHRIALLKLIADCIDRIEYKNILKNKKRVHNV